MNGNFIEVYALRMTTNSVWDPELHEAMVNAYMDIFEISDKESLFHLKCLENLEKISQTNGPKPCSLPVDNKKSVTSSVGKSKNH
jgi:hypothetical protein